MSTRLPTKQKLNTVDSLSQAQEPTYALYDWRSNVLDIFLPLASLAFFPSIAQTVLQAINDPQIAWQGAAIIVFFYLILVYATFSPKRLSTTTRSWIVVALAYLTGIVSMARGGLAGDGTIFLTVLPILTITLVNARAGVYAAGVSISTFVVFGILAHSGMLSQWLIIHDNPQTPDQWLYFGLAMSTLIIVTVFVVIKFSNFQMETLESVQEMTKALADSHRQLELANQKLEQKVQERTEELSNANQHLQFLATHDNLTGLPNRILFFDRLEQAIKKSRRQKRRFALFFIDLDDFKRINDSFGHIVGDQVLQTVADVLNHAVRDSDTVARLAGDEFMIILDDVRDISNIEAIARKIIKAVSQPIDVPQETVIMTVSIGISLFPDHGEDAETLLRKADAAMYHVKNGNKNGYLLHSE
ncbi:MAG: GGDEF domain-containing protein [Anaerolineales bacterium]|nr:GGDEF domain-containing protein [Anaerolineales bacterium]